MDLVQVILWLIYPYSVVAILGMGLVWQYDTGIVIEDKQKELKTNHHIKLLVTSLMGLCFITGLGLVSLSNFTNDPKQLFEWFLSILKLEPNMRLISEISTLSQIHLFLVLTTLLVLSFTKFTSYVFIPHHLIKGLFVKKINKL